MNFLHSTIVMGFKLFYEVFRFSVVGDFYAEMEILFKTAYPVNPS
ncbi:MAG: hypothetical protein RMJ15_01995 [Nitrososphaerota archaeon]|nr:hypothetical protein [Nitrososphaerota archaeon]